MKRGFGRLAGSALAILASPVPALAGDAGIAQEIDRAVPAYVSISTAPSVSIGIIKDGQVFYEKSFGYADKSRAIPATPDTLYGIGSITKVYAATLAVILRDEGKVDLDRPVSAYLPANVKVPPDAEGRPISLTHLLTHTSGLPADPGNRRNQTIEGLGSFDPTLPDAYGIADLRAALPATRIERPAGKEWSYSNYGYQLVGHVLESAAGIPFDRLLRQKILAPLGMDSTSIIADPARDARYAAAYWQIDRHGRERPPARFGEVAAAGGLASSVRDMLKFAQLQLKTVDRPGDPIPLRSLQDMRRPRVVIKKRNEQRNRPLTMQALGWRVQLPENGPTVYEHGGSLDGHTASIWISPQERMAIVILSNSDQSSPVVNDIREWLIALLRGRDRSAVPAGADPASSAAVDRIRPASR